MQFLPHCHCEAEGKPVPDLIGDGSPLHSSLPTENTTKAFLNPSGVLNIFISDLLYVPVCFAG